jgi:hypothetical protein
VAARCWGRHLIILLFLFKPYFTRKVLMSENAGFGLLILEKDDGSAIHFHLL